VIEFNSSANGARVRGDREALASSLDRIQRAASAILTVVNAVE
jgi:hypothetical protein